MDEAHPDLVHRASRGEEPALAELLARHLPGLLAYVRLHCGPMVLARESASDVAQSVCRELLEGGVGFQYRGEAAFRKWLFATAANMIKERQRHWLTQKRDVRREVRGPEGGPEDGQEAGEAASIAELLPTFTTPSRVAIREEDMQRLEHAFAELPEDQQRVISLAKLVGLPHREIADEMGRSEGAVRVLLHRALFRLATLLDRR